MKEIGMVLNWRRFYRHMRYFVTMGALAAVAFNVFSASAAGASGEGVAAADYIQPTQGGQNIRNESKFYGVIQKLPKDMFGIWNVSGREITVTRDTRIKEKSGRIQVGAQIEVEGRNDIKSFIAYEVEVDDRKFYGVVEKIPKDMIGAWMVSGREITVTRDTRIKEKYGRVQTGAYVEIEGIPDGKQFIASRVKTKRQNR